MDKPKTIDEAILYVQNNAPIIGKETKNPFFKSNYADLPTIWKAIKDIIKEAGLSVSTTTDFDESGREYVTTSISGHGQAITSRSLIMLGKRTPQEYGSFLTYIRRYHLSSMLGLQVDEDDDGNASSVTQSSKPEADPLKEKANNIAKQLRQAETLKLLDYVWQGFGKNKQLDEIKAASEKAYNSLEGIYLDCMTKLEAKENDNA